MAERLHPGVYVEEVSSGVRPIEGVSTSTAAFVGEAARGIPALAQFVTNFGDYERLFGGHRPGDAGLLATAVDGFFAAGGKRAYVVRVLPSDAVKGQSSAVNTRLTGSTVPALRFLARGAGGWADAIRINIAESTNFKDEAFRVDVFLTEGGASRRVESFDDVRMDPSHEDYVGERLKTSRYVDIEDLFAPAVDASTAPVVNAIGPLLTARAGASSYLMYENKVLTVSSWDTLQPDAATVSQEVKFDQALLNGTFSSSPPQFTDGSVQLTASQLATLLNETLTKFDASASANPPSIGLQLGRAPSAVIRPPGGAATWDLSTDNLRVTVNGGAPVDIDVGATAADASQTTAAEIAAAINTSTAGVTAVVTGADVTVTGATSGSAVPTLAIVSTPTAGVIDVTVSAGQQGVAADRLDGLRMSISELNTASAPPVLRALGFPGSARGFGPDSAANPSVRPALTIGLRLAGGFDGDDGLTPADFQGDVRERTGLHALDGVDANLVALPGKNDVAYISVGLAYCDHRQDCFYVVDGPGGSDRQVEVKPDDAKQFVQSLPSRSKNSAMFYPWIRVSDPVGVGRNPTRFVPPSGHVAGIFARTDVSRGVWKAPAGIEATVAQAVGLQYQVLDAEQDLLNPVSLNCLRQFPGTGIVSWGTRTLSSDPEWRYVPVRRTALFIKESLRRGLQWAVFEPNDTELWVRIATNIRSFMMVLFRQGAFQGATPDEAFSVQCDRSTNPQENIDAGIVTAKVAFAPLKPAEFVVIEISQKSLLVP
jgi:phage tail sheath protein FI